MAKKKWKHLTTARAGAQKIIESSGDCTTDYLYSAEMSFLDGIKKRKRRRSSPDFSRISIQNGLPLSIGNFVNNHTDQPNSSNINEKNDKPLAKHQKLAQQDDQIESDANEQLLSAIEAAIGNSSKQSNAEEEETEGMLFGKLIGRRLDKLDARKRAKLFIDIQSLLFKYEYDE
ncbi:hypothetical protein M3Y97_01138700 [Aphelenchoides bicaudatus]|nr:hypothetical protein M3Y97_01138700 [Aphelenchoides bicaudatus]